MNRNALIAALALAFAWHVWGVAAAWQDVANERGGRDFASYYYAMEVAADGGNPYDKAALGGAAKEDGTRSQVHPYFYPPPFLLLMPWTRLLTLGESFRAWFFVDEALALASVAVLAAWWRSASQSALPAIAVVAALCTAIPNNHAMGQANFPVLLVTLLGVWQADRRPWLAGALVGAACMWKMSPALFVAWWLVERRWQPAIAAIVTALALTLASLPFCGPAVQADFYLRVLPGFGSGRYNGLTVPIGMFGNHSIPNLLHQVFPGSANQLSVPARVGSLAALLGVSGGTLYVAHHRSRDALGEAGAIAAIAAALLLVPVYTYEHHVVWALPAAAICAVGVYEGRLPRWSAALFGLAIAAYCFDLQTLKSASHAAAGIAGVGRVVSESLQEAKCAALVTLWAGSLWVARKGES